MVSICMFFMALAAAFLVRKTGNDWINFKLPPIVWINTIVLLTSSLTIDLARKTAAAITQANLSGQITGFGAITVAAGHAKTAVVTYSQGQRAGIYTFTSGRLSSIERGPEPVAPPKTARSKPKPKKPAAT